MSGRDESRSYLLECYRPGVGVEKLTVAAGRAQQAADEVRGQGRELHFVGSIRIPADETVFSLIDGEEADIRAASERAGVPFERFLESLRIDGNQREEKEKCGEHSYQRSCF